VVGGKQGSGIYDVSLLSSILKAVGRAVGRVKTLRAYHEI